MLQSAEHVQASGRSAYEFHFAVQEAPEEAGIGSQVKLSTRGRIQAIDFRDDKVPQAGGEMRAFFVKDAGLDSCQSRLFAEAQLACGVQIQVSREGEFRTGEPGGLGFFP